MAQAVGHQVSLTTLFYSLVVGMGTHMSKDRPHWDEGAFWRKLILPQEDRETPWEGKGYRWFRSPNIVPIEQWRRQDEGLRWPH
jgi:hypothetical protein